MTDKDEYLALYTEGRPTPCGAIRKSYAEQLLQDLQQTGRNYWTEPITPEEAKRIIEQIVGTPGDLQRIIEQIIARPSTED